MDSSHWSNGIRYHTFDTRPDTEFKRFKLQYEAIAFSFCFKLKLAPLLKGKLPGMVKKRKSTGNGAAPSPAASPDAAAVGRCRSTASKPVLKAPIVSALEATI